MKPARLAGVLLIATLSVGCEEPAPQPPVTPAQTARPAPAPAAASSAPPRPATQTVTKDTPITTSGASLTVPSGWTVTTDGARTTLTGPEPELKVTLVDGPSVGADDAVAAAWKVAHPGFHRPLHAANTAPGRHGWSEERRYEYETSPDEKLVVIAWVMRRPEGTTALLVESSVAALDKRIGSLKVVLDTLTPKGYVRETFVGKTAHPLDAARLQRIEDVVEAGRKAIAAPGVVFGLVQNGKVTFRGLGVRELGKADKVDADTLFMIASNTKALATLLLAKEVDEGKFTWDSPVVDVYPGFKLGDAAVTKQVLIKHLVCACTGLPRQDLEWIFEYKNATPKSTFDVLGTFVPTTKFGEAFQYSNLMASAAGFIGGHVAYPNEELGAAFDHAMKAKLFGPLGMTATTFDMDRALRQNHASAHSPDPDGRMRIASMGLNRSIAPVRPAGGAWSSARDVLRYVQLELANGALPSGQRLVSEANLLARRAPQVRIGETTTYGMGLEVDTEWGIPFVHHGGDLAGFHSDMFWIPDASVGGVILTNADGGWFLRRPFIRRVLEVLFDGQEEAQGDVLASAERFRNEIAKERERLVIPAAPEATAKLAARYHNAALGELVVRAAKLGATFDFGEWKSAVASRKNDDGSFSLITTDPGVSGFEFVIADRGGQRALVIRDAQHEYVFEAR